jgi:hypothetical protein
MIADFRISRTSASMLWPCSATCTRRVRCTSSGMLQIRQHGHLYHSTAHSIHALLIVDSCRAGPRSTPPQGSDSTHGKVRA